MATFFTFQQDKKYVLPGFLRVLVVPLEGTYPNESSNSGDGACLKCVQQHFVSGDLTKQ